MKNLWYKQIYVADILEGRKTDTFRKPGELFEIDQKLKFSVGPRPWFAIARVTALELVPRKDIEEKRLEALTKFYGELPFYLKVSFIVEEVAGSSE